MTTVHFVQKAQKNNPAVKKGESYYWWKFRRGGKHYSKDRPKRSQLTQSTYLSTIYGIQEDAETVPAFEDIEEGIENIKSSIEDAKSECEDNLENIPENFREGDAANTLNERIEACDAAISDLESVDTDIGDRDPDEAAGEVWQEVQEALEQLDA